MKTIDHYSMEVWKEIYSTILLDPAKTDTDARLAATKAAGDFERWALRFKNLETDADETPEEDYRSSTDYNLQIDCGSIRVDDLDPTVPQPFRINISQTGTFKVLDCVDINATYGIALARFLSECAKAAPKTIVQLRRATGEASVYLPLAEYTRFHAI